MSTKSTWAPQYRPQLALATKVLGLVQVARPQVEGQAGDVQGCGGVAHGDAVGGLATLGDGLLEAFDGRALGQPVGTQGVDHRIDVGLADVLATVGNHGQAQASASCRSSGTLR